MVHATWYDRVLGRVALDRVISTITIVALLGAVYILRGRTGTDLQGDRLETVAVEAALPRHTAGSASARVVVIEFADFECPYSARHASDVFPIIWQSHVETGRVRYGFRHLPLAHHKYAGAAAVLAECLAQDGLFWRARSELFALGGRLQGNGLVGVRRSLRGGVTAERCLEGPEALSLLADDIDEASRLGIMATPTLVIASAMTGSHGLSVIDRLVGLQSVDFVVKRLDEALAQP